MSILYISCFFSLFSRSIALYSERFTWNWKINFSEKNKKLLAILAGIQDSDIKKLLNLFDNDDNVSP